MKYAPISFFYIGYFIAGCTGEYLEMALLAGLIFKEGMTVDW
jgi:hypothetical protein